MNNTTYSIHTLSKSDITNILESLLFASSVDVCADWFKENSLEVFNLAKKIRLMFPDITLENIYVYDNDEKLEFNDEHSNEIIKFFPEIKKEQVKQ
jgi:hypothetical protein